MAMAVWDPLRSTRSYLNSCSLSSAHKTTSTSSTSSTSISTPTSQSKKSSVGTTSAAARLYYQNAANESLVMGGQSMCRRRISISLAKFEGMHIEPRVHCTARGEPRVHCTAQGSSGIPQIAGAHRPDTLNLQSNGDGEGRGRRLKKKGGSGNNMSRGGAGRLSNQIAKKRVKLTRVTSSGTDSPSPATSAEATSASDGLETDPPSSLSSPTPPDTSAISFERGVNVERGANVERGVNVEGGGNVEVGVESSGSFETGVLSREAEREAEAYAVVYTGDYECRSCGYEYIEVMGDASYPIPPGMPFTRLPSDWTCPVCGAPRTYFNAKRVEIAGFVQNQKYGLGGNSLTSGQKSLLIYGSLLFFFAIFLSGYLLQ